MPRKFEKFGESANHCTTESVLRDDIIKEKNPVKLHYNTYFNHKPKQLLDTLTELLGKLSLNMFIARGRCITHNQIRFIVKTFHKKQQKQLTLRTSYAQDECCSN